MKIFQIVWNLIDHLLQSLLNECVHRRQPQHRFKRAALLQASHKVNTTTDHRVTGARRVFTDARRIAADNVRGVIARMSSHEDGLSKDEARQLQRRLGYNEVEHEKALHGLQHLWQCYSNPFNLLLTLLALISFLTEDMEAAVVIGTMVVLDTVIRFAQEGRSSRAAARLKAMVSNTVRAGRPFNR